MTEYIDTGIKVDEKYFRVPIEPTAEEKIIKALNFLTSLVMHENGKIIKRGVLYANGDIDERVMLCKDKKGRLGLYYKHFYRLWNFIPVEGSMEQRYPNELIRFGDLSICGEWVDVE